MVQTNRRLNHIALSCIARKTFFACHNGIDVTVIIHEPDHGGTIGQSIADGLLKHMSRNPRNTVIQGANLKCILILSDVHTLISNLLVERALCTPSARVRS